MKNTKLVLPISRLKADPEKKYIWERINKDFDIDENTIIITCGENIYCNSVIPIPILEHEKCHLRQQKAMGWKAWWNMYFESDLFRYEQELEAHKIEARWWKMSKKPHDEMVVERFNTLYKVKKIQVSDLYE